MINFDKLAGKMAEKRFSQIRLAKETKLSTTTMSLIMTGQRDVKLGNILKICIALDLTPNERAEFFLS
jgi:DNA-binding Xre family transcriptional regulator